MKHKYLILSIPTILYVLSGIFSAVRGNYSACLAWYCCATIYLSLGIIINSLKNELREQDVIIDDLIDRVLKLSNILEHKDEN